MRGYGWVSAERFFDIAAETAAKNKLTNSMATRKKSKTGKRTMIAPAKRGKRYVRRNKRGQFKKEVSVGRSLAADRRRKSKTRVAKGQGDRGETA